MRKGNILIPVVIAFFAITAFLLVLNEAIPPKAKNTNTTKITTNAVSNTVNNTTANSNTSVNTNTATDATKDWITYDNAEYGFSMKFPQTWGKYSVTTQKSKTTQNFDGTSSTYDIIEFIPAKSAGQGHVSLYILVVSDANQPVPSGTTKLAVQGDKRFYWNKGLGAPENLLVQYNQIESIVSTFNLNPFAGWKTYTNSVYGYSIKYPTTYTVTEKNTIGELTPEHATLYSGQAKGVYTNSIVVYTLTYTNNTLDSFSGEGTGWYNWAMGGFLNDSSVMARLSTNKRTEIYGGKTYTVVNFDPASSWGGAPFYYYVSGKIVYLIADVRGNNDEDVHNMLSTFSVTDPTAGWKTYTNSQYGFSFRYPAPFGTFVASTHTEQSYRGVEVASASSTTGDYRGIISISIKDTVFNSSHVEGLYGPITTKNLTSVHFGSRAGVMYLDGDAGCGAQEVLTSIKTTKTIYVSFGDCVP